MHSTQSHLSFAVSPVLIAKALLLDTSSPVWIPAAGPGQSPCLPSPSPNPTEQTLGDLPDEVTKLKIDPVTASPQPPLLGLRGLISAS